LSSLIIQPPAVKTEKVTCQRCSKQKSKHEVMQVGTTTSCFDCYQKHREAMDQFVARDERECFRCRVPLFTLRNVTGYLVIVDGGYGLACKACRDWYRTKRRDLFKGTSLGHHLKL
jgi:hypothetical protein